MPLKSRRISITPKTLLWAVSVLAACSTTSSGKGLDPSAVKLVRRARSGCKKIHDIVMANSSRRKLRLLIRREAARINANYVLIQSLKVGSITGTIKAHGTLLRCPPVGTKKDRQQTEAQDEELDENMLWPERDPDRKGVGGTIERSEGSRPPPSQTNDDSGALP